MHLTAGDLEDAFTLINNSPYLKNTSRDAKERFVVLLQKLLEANKLTNLTAVRDVRGIITQHFADSCAILDALPNLENLTFCDLGTGAGFPLLPLCIVRSDWKGTGIESVGKKTAFISSVSRAMGIDNVSTLTLRGEEVGRSERRETYDMGVSRAVGPVSSLVEILMPLVKVGGRVVLYKTINNRDEVRSAGLVISRLGGGEAEEVTYSIDETSQSRALIIIKKVAPSPLEYPRRVGVPFKKPLS